jgi:hypothetical protein
MITGGQTDSFFAPVFADRERDAVMTGYLQFLERRNGASAADAPFAHRERWLAHANASPERYGRTLAPETFDRNFAAFDGREVEDPCLRAMLAFVKINSGEAYGVEAVGRARRKRPQSDTPMARVERMVMREEEYHTRILLGATHQFGLAPPNGAYRPPLAVKALIGTLVHAPEAFFHPVLLAAEVAGLFHFNWLLVRVGEVFASWPALRDGLESRLVEILIDEVGHVAFNRAAVGPHGITAARALAPNVAFATAAMLPELGSLGWTRHALDSFERFNLSSLPAAARARAFYV